MPLTASKLRADVYRILDEILQTGIPVDVERKGRTLRIAAVDAPSKLTHLAPRSYLACDPEELVEMDWTHTWSADRALDPGPDAAPGGGGRDAESGPADRTAG